METFRMQTFMKPVDSVLFFTVIFVVTGLACSDSRCITPSVDGYPSALWFDTDTSNPGSCDNLCREGHRCINRMFLKKCSDPSPHLQMNLSTHGPLADEEYITVTINGLSNPTNDIWVALVSPSTPNISNCPLNRLLYLETGDLKDHSLLCHYSVKSQFLTNDPSYKACTEKRSSCKLQKAWEECEPKTCDGSIAFHVINIRTDIEFVLFSGGYGRNPCVLRRSEVLKFSNPNMPLYPHLSSVDSTGSSMKLTWIGGSNTTQFVQYGSKKSAISTVTTFTQADMCRKDPLIPSPAMDFGWHDPGYIHTALMKGLRPSHEYSYKYGSDKVGWSSPVSFSTPPASGASEVRFLAFGDMGKAPRDASDEHYIQPGSLGVIEAITEEVSSGKVDSVFHIGDISYATGFLVEWDFFLQMITPVASRLSYMTAIGNHERDYPDSGSKYTSTDSGGECGVPYEKYFPMPTTVEDKPWYSISQGTVHFTVMSTEHNWAKNSEQYEWIRKDLASVDRKKTPWLIFTGHRPMYSNVDDGIESIIIRSVDPDFALAIEPLLLDYKVDLALWGHVHNYERTCALFKKTCKSLPTKDVHGIDTYNSANYSAPVHAVIGMAGFSLDNFTDSPDSWSLVRISGFGYTRVHATTRRLLFEFVSSDTRAVNDSFQMTR